MNQIRTRIWASRRRLAACLASFLMAVSAFVLTLGLSAPRSIRAAGPTCSVPGDYSTIKAAVADAGCLTINVGTGTYNEYDIIISRDVKIVGNSSSPASVIVDAGNTTHRGFYINASQVITISGVTIQHGRAGGDGGAIENHGMLWLDHSVILSNTLTGAAGTGGAGIYNVGSAILTSVTLRANIAPTSSIHIGGALYNDTGGSITIIDSLIEHNAANEGGGIDNVGATTLANTTFTANRAYNDGGGISNAGQLTLTSSSLISNSAVTGGGFSNFGTATLSNTTFTANTANNNGGGINNGGQLTLTSTSLIDNSAAYGGGIMNGGASLVTLISSTFNNNSAANDGGGIVNNGDLSVLTSTLINNTALNGNGGALYNLSLSNGLASVRSSTFSGNSANSSGGAIYSTQSDTLNLINDTLSYNTASIGGGMAHYTGTATIVNSTFNGNIASSGGGNLSQSSGTLSIKNTLVVSGTPANCSGSITNGSHNLQYGDSTCGGAITNQNPLLGPLQINAPGNTATYALLADSPAIDAGTNTGCPATDQRGVARPINSTCDIGAYEYGWSSKIFLPLTLR